jgi:hypothetical protein
MLTLDYKTINDLRHGTMLRNQRSFGYDVQAYHYSQSRRWLKTLLQSLRQQDPEGTEGLINDYIYIDEDSQVTTEWMYKLIDMPHDQFYFLFQKKKPPYSVKTIWYDEGTYQDAERDVNHAKAEYIKYMAKFGTEQWLNSGEAEEWSIRYGSVKPRG